MLLVGFWWDELLYIFINEEATVSFDTGLQEAPCCREKESSRQTNSTSTLFLSFCLVMFLNITWGYFVWRLWRKCGNIAEAANSVTNALNCSYLLAQWPWFCNRNCSLIVPANFFFQWIKLTNLDGSVLDLFTVSSELGLFLSVGRKDCFSVCKKTHLESDGSCVFPHKEKHSSEWSFRRDIWRGLWHFYP